MARKKKITLPTEDDYSKEVGLEDRWHMVRLEEWSVMLYDESTMLREMYEKHEMVM